MATTLQSILTGYGYDVSVFTDSRSALDTLKNNSKAYDIIVTDYSLPDTTGLEIVKTLRAAGIDIPVIVLTGFHDKAMEAPAKALGVTELIPKPVNAYQITDAIRRMMQNKVNAALR